MSPNPSNINFIMLPGADGSFNHAALEDFSLAFAAETSASSVDDLLKMRDVIERSLANDGDRPRPAELKKFGQDIARVLLAGNVGSLYHAVGAGLVRITLCLADGKLKRVPWEYLVWPDLSEGHRKRSLARIVSATRGAVRSPKSLRKEKLKILLAGADLISEARTPWSDSRSSLERFFSLRLLEDGSDTAVEMDIIEAATRETLATALREKEYDVFQFIGHGRPNGLLLRGDDAGNGSLLPTEALCAMLSAPSLRLVILSACDTAKISNIEPLETIAEAVVRNDVPAVVANQMSISTSAIADFSVALYQSLLETGNIDIAVASGRAQLVVTLADVTDAALEWGIPVLYRRAGSSQLFEPKMNGS